jgi:glycine/D-amino acid oxidase-like deaminating enzyme/nitrite reductase/ring-hydroxylating ferredoxin subunit
LARSLPERPASPWLAEEAPPWPRLEAPLETDVAVVGGGIVGVTAARALAASGARVALLEADRIGAGVSGHTTAKLSSLHGLTYASLRSRYGEGVATAYAAANEAGIARVRSEVERGAIDCSLRSKPNYTYTERAERVAELEAEAEAAAAAGLAASLVDDCDLPFSIRAAVRVEEQAEFHPHRYLIALARAAEGDGARLFQRTRAVALEGSTIRLENGPSVRADRIIVATHLPFLDRGLWFARTYPERSYALSIKVEGELPQGMYLSAESPTRSIRSHPFDRGERLIVGGESHRPGAASEPDRYRALERWSRGRWPVVEVEHRWSAQDNMPVDGLPFVGRLWPLSDRALCATGLRKWGLAMGTTAAEMLAVMARGEDPPWGEVFRTGRLNLLRSARAFAFHNADSGFRFFADRVLRRASAGGLQPGEGRVVGAGLRQAAVYRDNAGALHRLSARCTHLGCIVHWNGAERSWDCPCHGSRFAPATGEVLQGPAVSRLARQGP